MQVSKSRGTLKWPAVIDEGRVRRPHFVRYLEYSALGNVCHIFFNGLYKSPPGHPAKEHLLDPDINPRCSQLFSLSADRSFAVKSLQQPQSSIGPGRGLVTACTPGSATVRQGAGEDRTSWEGHKVLPHKSPPGQPDKEHPLGPDINPRQPAF